MISDAETAAAKLRYELKFGLKRKRASFNVVQTKGVFLRLYLYHEYPVLKM